MRFAAIGLLVMALCLAAASQFEGTWVLESPLVPRPLEATFKVIGAEVSGTMKLGDGKVVPISAGKIDGNNISFRFEGLNSRTLEVRGLLKNDIIEFELLMPGNEYGSEYTAKKK